MSSAPTTLGQRLLAGENGVQVFFGNSPLIPQRWKVTDSTPPPGICHRELKYRLYCWLSNWPQDTREANAPILENRSPCNLLVNPAGPFLLGSLLSQEQRCKVQGGLEAAHRGRLGDAHPRKPCSLATASTGTMCIVSHTRDTQRSPLEGTTWSSGEGGPEICFPYP